MRRARRLRVCSLDRENLPRRSPFVVNQTPKDFMKARLVNNAVFHADFDATLMEKDVLQQARELLGSEQCKAIGITFDDFDKRYFQKYPKWKQLQKKEQDTRKKSF